MLLELVFFEQILKNTYTSTSLANTKKLGEELDVFQAKIFQPSNQFSSPKKNLCHTFCCSIITIQSKDFNSPQERNNLRREVLESERQSFPQKEVFYFNLDFTGLL